MQTLLMSKSLLVKWALPIALVLALVASFTVVGASEGGKVGLGSDDFGIADDFGDFNPAYENVLVGPAEDEDEDGGLPVMLYSLDVENQSTVVTLGGGDVMTLTLTNLIEEPIANGTYTVDGVAVNVTEHGDIGGNIVVTADMYAPDGYVLTAATLTPILAGAPYLITNVAVIGPYLAGLVSAGSSGLAAVEATISMLQDLPAATYAADVAIMQANKAAIAAEANEAFRAARTTLGGAMAWTMVTTQLPIITYSDMTDGYITCHPGKTVVVQVPIVPLCPVLTLFQYRAELIPSTNASVLL